MGTNAHLEKIFGSARLKELSQSKVLLVGAGGIGCELLKDLILMSFGEIHVVDLDTIDLSNLNRQFLFKQKDIKRSKSVTAVKAVQHFNHSATLVSHHGNIMDVNAFPLLWYNQFDIIFNALDNLEARNYINKIALFIRKPLMESGTTGFEGQVQPIFPYQTECFECTPKETPKTFPVCTIRSTPSKPIHCITWAKNFLFLQLFGEDTEDVKPEDLDTDDKKEIETLLKESNELADLKRLIKNSSHNDDSYVFSILKKIYTSDIERLLKLETLWTNRDKPVPLDLERINLSIEKFPDYQKTWSVEENLHVLINSIKRLAERYKVEKNIVFDKDDDDTLDFVVASSNLRSHVFNIELKSKFDIKQIAGNIIPAVATTNAIMAGLSALQSLNVFSAKRMETAKYINDSKYLNKFISEMNLSPPNPECKACSIVRGIVTVDVNKPLKALRDAIVAKFGYQDDISILAGKSRLLYDYDFEDNLEAALSTMGIADGEILSITDSDDVLDDIELYVHHGGDLKLPDISIPKKKVSASQKEAETIDHLNDDDIEELYEQDAVVELEDDNEPPKKRRKV